MLNDLILCRSLCLQNSCDSSENGHGSSESVVSGNRMLLHLWDLLGIWRPGCSQLSLKCFVCVSVSGCILLGMAAAIEECHYNGVEEPGLV